MSDLFLSRLRIPRIQQLKMHLIDEYDIHQLVYSLFPYEKKRNFLYFLDYGGMGDMDVLVQSEVMPDAINSLQIETKVIPEHFWKNRTYAFKLRISPVSKKDGKVVKVFYKHMEVVNWLVTRENSYGVHFNTNETEKISSGIMKMKSNDGRRITLSYVDLSGILDVVDYEKFVRIARSGIGPGKGFGMGMLRLLPIEKMEE